MLRNLWPPQILHYSTVMVILHMLFIIICVMNIICFFAWVLIEFLFNHEIQGHNNSLVGHRTTAFSASEVVLRISMYRNERNNK